jgi:hypothetical protein
MSYSHTEQAEWYEGRARRFIRDRRSIVYALLAVSQRIAQVDARLKAMK